MHIKIILKFIFSLKISQSKQLVQCCFWLQKAIQSGSDKSLLRCLCWIHLSLFQVICLKESMIWLQQSRQRYKSRILYNNEDHVRRTTHTVPSTFRSRIDFSNLVNLQQSFEAGEASTSSSTKVKASIKANENAGKRLPTYSEIFHFLLVGKKVENKLWRTKICSSKPSSIVVLWYFAFNKEGFKLIFDFCETSIFFSSI